MNKVLLVGRITKDLKISYSQNGNAYINTNIAVKNINQKEKTNFIPVMFWRKKAEIINQYSTKGTKVLIYGSLEVNEKFWYVNCEELELLESKNQLENRKNSNLEKFSETDENINFNNEKENNSEGTNVDDWDLDSFI